MHTINENFLHVIYNLCFKSSSLQADVPILKNNGTSAPTYWNTHYISSSATSSVFYGISLATGSYINTN